MNDVDGLTVRMMRSPLLAAYKAAVAEYSAACDAENGADGWRAEAWRRTDELREKRDAAAVELSDWFASIQKGVEA